MTAFLEEQQTSEEDLNLRREIIQSAGWPNGEFTISDKRGNR